MAASTKTEKSKYVSRYTDGYITAAQWVAERIVERWSKQKGLYPPPVRFWKDGRFASVFRRQVGLANDLIREFGEAAVVTALKAKSVEWVTSLGCKDFKEAVKHEAGRVRPASPEEPNLFSQGDKVAPEPMEKAGTAITAVPVNVSAGVARTKLRDL